MPRSVILPLCIAGLIVGGCADSSRMKVYPVAGKVLYQGQPAVGAEIAIFGLDEELKTPEAPFPKAVVSADGSFSLSSYALGDGAPAGNYAITIVWKKSTAADPEIRESARDTLRGRYASPETSGLAAEVQPRNNELPVFELK